MICNVCLIPILLCLLGSVINQSPVTSIQISLSPGSKSEFDVPIIFQGYQKIQLSPFSNQKTHEITSPCHLKLKVRPFFRRYGQLNHQLNSYPDRDFWQGGNLWDAIEVANRLVCVFQNGEVSQFATTAFETTFKPIQKLRNSVPFSGNQIDYGKLVHHEQNGDHILYVSESGCYLINSNGSWSKFARFQNNPDFQQAKIYNKKLFVAAGHVLYIYSVDIAGLSLSKQSEIALFFTQMDEQLDLTIYKFEYAADSNKMYVINREEGVKYFILNANQSQVEVSHLLPSQNCQDMEIYSGMLFLSCSHLVIANASTSELIFKQPYPFHVKNIIINDMYLTAFGETFYAVFWITGEKDNSAKARFLYKSELPLGKHQSFLYLPDTKMLVLLTKYGLSYGKIIADEYLIECSYLKAFQGLSQLDSQIFGSNSANLTIYGLCNNQDQEGVHLECSQVIALNVLIPDIKSYKFIIFLVVGVVVLLLLVLAVLKVVQLKKKKTELKYKQLAEQSQISVSVTNKKDQKAAIEMMKLQN